MIKLGQMVLEGVIRVHKSRRTSDSGSKSESKHDSRRPDRANGKNRCSHRCNVHEIEECHDDMADLNKQVQSLFYS